jgi:F0F1-type ATP synthase assembly protein I
MTKIPFTIIGALIGIPLSFYFQTELIQLKVGGMSGYLQHFSQVLDSKELAGNVLVSMIIFALIGALIGYLVDNARAKSN